MNDEPIEVKTLLVYQIPRAHARGYFHLFDNAGILRSYRRSSSVPAERCSTVTVTGSPSDVLPQMS